MLRPFRASDIPAYLELYRAHFPDEARVLLTDADGFRRVLERGLSPLGRLVLGLTSAFGRPIVDLLALEEDGRLVGATFLFYDGPTGYVSSVVVDTPYRRRGHAKELMAAAEARLRRRGRPNAVLDVIATNTPARALYDAIGYRTIRRTGWFVLDLAHGDGDLPALPADRAIRPLRRRDAVRLAAIASARQPPEDRAVRPIGPRAFRVPPLLARAFGSRTRALVWDAGDGAAGFVRSTGSGAMASGHLVPPIADASVGEDPAERLLLAGLAYFRGQGLRRIVAEAPLDDEIAVRRLAGHGFVEGLTMETMAKPLGGRG